MSSSLATNGWKMVSKWTRMPAAALREGYLVRGLLVQRYSHCLAPPSCLPISQRVGSLMSQPASRPMVLPWPSPPPSRRLKTGLFFPACLLQDPLMELPQNLNRLFAKAVKAER